MLSETYSERRLKQEKKELMQCSALAYKSFLDTVQVDLAGMKDMRYLLTNEQKDGVTLRT